MDLMTALLQQVANRFTTKVKSPRMQRRKYIYDDKYSHDDECGRAKDKQDASG